MEDISLFTRCVFEFIGTAVMILLGDGVVACTTLNKSKGTGGGWAVITLAWGFAVMCGVFIAGPYSGAHLNPAVSIGYALTGNLAWSDVPGYAVAQFLGAMLGALVVYLFYKDQFDATDDADTKLGVFCTMPAIMNRPRNLLCEIVGTFLLVFVILCFSTDGNVADVKLGSSGAFPVTMLIMAIGMSLGGTTGYAINPMRDLPPRIVHALLPIRGKRNSGWGYAWVPVIGPLIGCVLAAFAFLLLFYNVA